MLRSATLCLAALPLACAVPAAARDVPVRAAELVPILNGAGDVTRTFSPSFLNSVPEARLRAVAASVRAQLGRALRIARATRLDAQRTRLVIAYERGTADALLVVGPGASGQVEGFVIDTVMPAEVAALRTLDQVSAAMARLPGTTGFAVAAPDGRVEVALAPDRPLAIGSAFKLVILAELVRAVDAGERRWTDTLAPGETELPAGRFAHAASGTEATLRELAEAMIRVSDNSAADMLLQALGRERVEAMQAEVGFRHGAANVPFLSTMEAFKLKGVDGGAIGRRYLAADVAARRGLLADEIAHRRGWEVGSLFQDGRPVMSDSIEWFASPMDLVRAMGWFAGRETPAGGEARRILALNPGPGSAVRERFAYVGYKGGSEPGVLNMTLLVRDKTGRAKVVTASWNRDGPVDEARLAALVARALAILARS